MHCINYPFTWFNVWLWCSHSIFTLVRQKEGQTAVYLVCLILNRTTLKESIKQGVKKWIHFDFFFQAAYEKLPRSKQTVVVISTAHFCWHNWSTKHPISYSLHSVGEISYPHRPLFSVNYFSKQDVSNLNCITADQAVAACTVIVTAHITAWNI